MSGPKRERHRRCRWRRPPYARAPATTTVRQVLSLHPGVHWSRVEAPLAPGTPLPAVAASAAGGAAALSVAAMPITLLLLERR